MKRLFSKFLSALGRLAVGTQLMAGFAVVLVFTCALGGVAIVGLSQVKTQASSLNERWLHGVGHLAKMRNALADSREVEVKHSKTADKAEVDLMAKLDKGWAAYSKAQQTVVALGRDKKQMDAADISEGLGSTTFDDAMGALAGLNKFGFEGGKAAADEVNAEAR